MLRSKSITNIEEFFTRDLKDGVFKIRGWVTDHRSSGGIQFLTLRDGTGFMQCTMLAEKMNTQEYTAAKTVPPESVVELEGHVKKDARAPRGLEIDVRTFKIIKKAEEPYPIAKKYHGPDFLLDNRHLWIRSKKMIAILKVRASLLESAREWFKQNEYTEVQMPTLVSTACEGGSTLFEVKYFDQKAYLTQSWQLYAEATIASLGKIYTIAPSFRAETSRTRRHLTEYWHLETEAPWYTLEDIIQVQEKLISHICYTISEKRQYELQILGRNTHDLQQITPPFERLTYDQAINILQKDKVKAVNGEDLTYEQEKHLAGKYHTPFFVVNYPKKTKAFYHKIHPENPELTLSVDLLAPEGYGEITGGGQRIDDKKELLKRLSEEKIDKKEYSWYIDLRKYGSIPHSGFGLGIERMLAWICKLEHIRDATAFPRLINRISP